MQKRRKSHQNVERTQERKRNFKVKIRDASARRESNRFYKPRSRIRTVKLPVRTGKADYCTDQRVRALATKVQTLHTEPKIFLEKNTEKKYFSLTFNFKARMYLKLVSQSNSKSKICKHIIES
jgi:hypothetical protein